MKSLNSDQFFINKLRSRYLDKPSAATMTEWREWEEKASKDYPITFFFLEAVPDFFRNCYNRYWKWPVLEKIYNWKCKYLRKYHHIKIDVDRFIDPVGQSKLAKYHWYDSDTRILYGMFQILVDYYEKEEPGEQFDWTASPEHERIWAEINELYKWWTVTRPNRPDSHAHIEDSNHGCEGPFMVFDLPDNDPRYIQFRADMDRSRQIEAEYQQEDTEMLIRLITIRENLWT